MNKVKYRLNDPRLAPRRTKLEIPGWAGKREPRTDGSREQVWHCVPFSEGAQYGIELFYPYDTELRVSTKDGQLILDGDWGPPPDGGVQWPPFRNFGDHFYTYQILLDLKVEKGMAIRTEPHPRFYTDRTDTVPIAVPALVRNWWPMLFFMVATAHFFTAYDTSSHRAVYWIITLVIWGVLELNALGVIGGRAQNITNWMYEDHRRAIGVGILLTVVWYLLWEIFF